MLRTLIATALIAPTLAGAETVFDTGEETVFDTGEDRYAEDGPWIEVPADYQETRPTLVDITRMADLDGDPDVVTADEQDMINIFIQVLIPAP